MKKVLKVLMIILCIACIGAGGFGTFYFWNQNKNQISQNVALTSQNSQIQAELNAIGALTTVYEVNTKVYSGNEVLETELVPVSVPTSTLAESSIEDISELVGKHYRVNISPGTIISRDMLMDEFDGTKEKYPREVTFTSLPVSTTVGDYIDMRIMIPNGEEYVIFSHKQIKRLYDNTITFFMSEEENAILNSVFQDVGNYSQFCIVYIMKYLEPGNDTDTVAFYPVQHEVENFIRFNPNIQDTTRCINEDLRNHIDEVFLTYTNSANASVSSSFISNLASQYSSQLAAHQRWKEEHTDDDGNMLPDEYDDLNGHYVQGEMSYQEVVGEAMDGLEQGIQDLEAIE